MVQTRLEISRLEAGDIVRQRFQDRTSGHITEQTRHVIVSGAELMALPYRGHIHAVTLVTGLDIRTGKDVSWVAVPDQYLTVTREG